MLSHRRSITISLETYPFIHLLHFQIVCCMKNGQWLTPHYNAFNRCLNNQLSVINFDHRAQELFVFHSFVEQLRGGNLL